MNFFLSFVIAVVVLFPGIARASLRCPGAVIGPPASIVPETDEITLLWRALAVPKTDASDGPLGCPLDGADVVIDSGSGWTGVVQGFQRGQILVGRGSFAGFEAAAVRGLGGWFVWWKFPGATDAGAHLLP